MANTPLTAFQRDAEESIRRLLAKLGRSVDSREVLRGVVPFYSPEPQTVVKLQSGDFEVWLYDDEASFSTSAGGGAVERLDFRSEPELLTTLLQQIQVALTR
jgi:hypothetical protein